MCLPRDGYPGILAKARIDALENELVLVRAQAAGAASLLLDVQKDCIESKAELKGVQIAYGELSQKYDQLKMEYEHCCTVYDDWEEDAPDWSL